MPTDAQVESAEAALRHNIRLLTPTAPASLSRAAEEIGGAEGLALLAHRAAVEALAVEGLRPDQERVLRRTAQTAGGHVLSDREGTRALLIGPIGVLASVAAHLFEWGSATEDLSRALSAALASRHARPPIACGERKLTAAGGATLVMGVVNATPDSFSGDGVGGDVDAAVELAQQMVADGADAVDVGGESTRPNSQPVDAATELSRVLPIVEALAARLPVPVSIDTRKAEVAAAAIAAGATMVNDVWGLRGDPAMAQVLAAQPEVALVVMHNRRGHQYRDLLADIARDLRESLLVAARNGIEPHRIVVDPGFGFGKTPAQNLELVQRLGELGGIGHPLLVGPSRKSTIGLVLGGAPPELRVEGTLALCILAVAAGAEMVRVHDVAAVRRGLRLADAVLREIPEEVREAPLPGPTG
ncbi:MAG TPA: dihydropteroate synthase [Candidatus Binatia bacterium]|nr:dihydropteroate synthase [Candidatus Binatia bacterium]